MWPLFHPRFRLRIALRVIFIVGASIAGYTAAILFEEKLYSWATWPTAVILLIAIAEFVVADFVVDRFFPASTVALLRKLDKDLHSFHDQLRWCVGDAISELRASDPANCSGTIHLLVEVFSAVDGAPEPALVQIVNYAGSRTGGKWRIYATSKGIIGRCVRSSQLETVSFASEQEFRQRMVEEFGFTRDEMLTRTQDARSYLAKPLKSGARLLGVLYLYSTEPQVFPRAIDEGRLEYVAQNIVRILQVAKVVV
jgi:hypothetical protein